MEYVVGLLVVQPCLHVQRAVVGGHKAGDCVERAPAVVGQASGTTTGRPPVSSS